MARSEIHSKYIIIGKNVYSYLLYKMLGKNCIVISHNQPFYLYSFDNLIIKTPKVEKFFDYYPIDKRIDYITIGSMNKVKNIEPTKRKLKELGLFIDFKNNPEKVTIYIPVDFYSKYYIEDEIEKIKFDGYKFRIYLRNNKNVFVSEKIINTLPLKQFLKLLPNFSHMKDYYHYTAYKRFTYITTEFKNLAYKVRFDINVDYNKLAFDCYRKFINHVIADLIGKIGISREHEEYCVLLEVQNDYYFERELGKRVLFKNVYNMGRYAQVLNEYTLDDFILDITEFEADDVYHTGEILEYYEEESDN